MAEETNVQAVEILRLLREQPQARGTGNPPVVIADLTAAVFRAYWNELALDERQGVADPCKLRFGAWRSAGTGYLGAISMDVLDGDAHDPVRREKGILAFKLDPHPMLELFLQRRVDTTEDRDMVRVATFTADGIEFHAPVKFIQGGAQPAPPAPPPVHPPAPAPAPPPSFGYVYRGFRQGDWAALRAAGPVEDTDPGDYAKEPTEARWRDYVEKMLRRRG